MTEDDSHDAYGRSLSTSMQTSLMVVINATSREIFHKASQKKFLEPLT